MKKIYLSTKELSNFIKLANENRVMFMHWYNTKTNLVEIEVAEVFADAWGY